VKSDTQEVTKYQSGQPFRDSQSSKPVFDFLTDFGSSSHFSAFETSPSEAITPWLRIFSATDDCIVLQQGYPHYCRFYADYQVYLIYAVILNICSDSDWSKDVCELWLGAKQDKVSSNFTKI